MRIFKNVFAFILILLSMQPMLSACKLNSFGVYIFSDLSECHGIETNAADDARITLHDAPVLDKYIADLEYTDFYACNYLSSEMRFTLFAYEFPDQTGAQNYYFNATGSYSPKEINFNASHAVGAYKHVAVKGNLAYSVYSTSKDSYEVIGFINQIFTVRMV